MKTFFVGILLGLAGTAGALYALPVVNQEREASIVSVSPNGGNVEAFHVNVPMDRVMIGASGQAGSLPPGLDWPVEAVLADTRAEVFKVRNAHDAVVGVAVRAAATNGDDVVIDWVLHLPARGSIFVTMDAVPQDGGFRIGEITAGSREFEPFVGVMTERWVANTSGDEDAPTGRIELTTSYVGQLEPLELEETFE